MQLSIFDKNISLSESQKDYIAEKIDNLMTYGERIGDESTKVRVDVQMNNSKTTNKNITVQVTMSVPHSVVRAEIFSTTVEEGIDLAVDKLKKQLERYKGKQTRRDMSGKWIPASTLDEMTLVHEKEIGFEDKIVKRKAFDLVSMHEEEAVEQLELLGHPFYAFLNSENEKFCVVYKRENGNYGLLQFSK